MVKAKMFVVWSLSESMIKKAIQKCKNVGHFQQVVYSVHGDVLTQICFECQMIRSSFK